MSPYCVDCVHRWLNGDGLNMCGRPTETPGPKYCFSERANPPDPGRDVCGPRAQYFEPKP